MNKKPTKRAPSSRELPGPLGWIGEGLALPQRFTAEAEAGGFEGPGYRFHISIDVELADGRLRAHRVCVETDSDRGVTAAALRSVSVRRIVTANALQRVARVTLGPKATSYETANPKDADVIAAVEAAVGYVEAKP